jgi:DNA/RNA-binding domain of Phe-tRNA-synthetase-like protein
MLTVTGNWKKTYPDAHFGILVMKDVSNPLRHPGLDRVKRELEDDLRALFKDPAELKLLGPIRAYKEYYKKFDKTYHVLQQLESVIFKGKSIPAVSPLVECMFIEELRNLLLTAGHDLDSVDGHLTLDVAKGDELYTRINGRDQIVKLGDMILKDSEGIISSVIYGPDQRTKITPSTSKVLFTVYSVPGIGENVVAQHLQGIEANVRIVAPQSKTDILKVYGTD